MSRKKVKTETNTIGLKVFTSEGWTRRYIKKDDVDKIYPYYGNIKGKLILNTGEEIVIVEIPDQLRSKVQ